MPARLPGGTGGRRARPSSAVPLWPLLTAGVVLLLAYNVYHTVTSKTAMSAVGSVTRATFSSVVASRPLTGTAMASLAPVRASVPPYPVNLQFGTPGAATTVTIFTDPACGPCRETIGITIGNLEDGNVRIVHKFLPRTGGTPTPGILQEIARRNGKAAAFIKALAAAPSTLDDTAMLALLESLGIPLDLLRSQLAAQSEEILAALAPDIATAQNLNLGTPPQFFVGDYLIDGRILTADRLSLYVTRVGAGKSPVQADDYWLNPGR